MTEPLTPPDCDLRGLPFMPLDVVRLVDSDLVALTTGDEFKAAVVLWCKAWLQVPAASLPDDDRVLAHLSGTGPRWRKLRPMALHGFVKCADGRLYHPVVAEKAREAWKHRCQQRDRANKRWGKGEDASSGNADEPSPGNATASATASATAMQGTGTGTGTVKEELHAPHARVRDDRINSDPLTPAEEAAHGDLMSLADRCHVAAGYQPVTPQGLNASIDTVKAWREEGFDFDLDVIPTIEGQIKKFSDPANSLRCFTKFVRHAHARRKAGGESAETIRRAEEPLSFEKPGEDAAMRRVRSALADELEPASYRSWIDPTRLMLGDGSLTVVAGTSFAADWLANNFGARIKAAARNALGLPVDVRFKVEPQRAAA